MAMAVIDGLEIVDVEHEHRERLAALGERLEQRLQMARHIAAVVECRERVEDPHPQMVGVALALHLGAHPAARWHPGGRYSR
jgi:hypothetical protein